ncbi:MAG: DUF1638 domain-containing protein [Pseudomonadota bacterium]
MIPDDATLTRDGLRPEGAGRILLLACGALAREILALKSANGWEHMTLACLPASYHNTPEKIVPAVHEAVAAHRDTYEQIFVVYADCGTGGLLEAACEELGVRMVEGPHCYSFFEGNDTFIERDEMTAFYLTDFLVRQFDAFVTKPLGLDRDEKTAKTLRDMYFSHYDKLVYQAQIRDPALEAKAQACAEKLGLSYEYRFTGYGDLERSLSAL